MLFNKHISLSGSRCHQSSIQLIGFESNKFAMHQMTCIYYLVIVVSFKGDVQLSGFVSSVAQATRAVDISKTVSGVTSVKNDMRVNFRPVLPRFKTTYPAFHRTYLI